MRQTVRRQWWSVAMGLGVALFSSVTLAQLDAPMTTPVSPACDTDRPGQSPMPCGIIVFNTDTTIDGYGVDPVDLLESVGARDGHNIPASDAAAGIVPSLSVLTELQRLPGIAVIPHHPGQTPDSGR